MGLIYGKVRAGDEAAINTSFVVPLRHSWNSNPKSSEVMLALSKKDHAHLTNSQILYSLASLLASLVYFEFQTNRCAMKPSNPR